jgi:hypothetical protein
MASVSCPLIDLAGMGEVGFLHGGRCLIIHPELVLIRQFPSLGEGKVDPGFLLAPPRRGFVPLTRDFVRKLDLLLAGRHFTGHTGLICLPLIRLNILGNRGWLRRGYRRSAGC